MDDATFVRRVEGVRNLYCDFDNAIVGQRLVCNEVLEGPACEALHHNERLTVSLVNLVNRADVRVVESGSGAGFSLEPLEGLTVPHQSGWEKLNSNVPAEAKIHGAVDHSHATAAEMFFDPVV